jgi:hypothetical protein
MTEDQITEQVTHLFNAIKANDDPTQRKIGAAIVSRFLFNFERIAEGLERLGLAVDEGSHGYTYAAVRTREQS